MRKMKFYQLITTSAFLFLPAIHFAQLSDSTVKKIDALFKSLNNKTPGCAVAVSKNGEVIFQKGYGMANLEYDIPITPKTIFHIASISKQYTAFCMLLLEKEGKLSLDDDIRKYLEYIPDFGYKITIRHLINHTSGLRDQWQLLANAGWQLDDVITQQQIIKVISMQKDLNFKPGDEYMYSNTGYTLMAEIVKKVSGLTLREYTDKNIFKPLGMLDTHFNDNYKELVPNRAYSYSQAPGRFENAVLSYSTVGATSLMTTVLDQLKWMNNFATGAVGGKDLIEKMKVQGILNDGRKILYANGVVVNEYKGWKTVGHNGSDAGFATYGVVFPELGLDVVMFANSYFNDPGDKSFKLVDILVEQKKGAATAAKIVKTDSSFQKKFVGRFYSDRDDLMNIRWQDGKLKWGTFVPNRDMFLNKTGDNRFSVADNGTAVIIDPKKVRDSVQSFLLQTPDKTIEMKRLPAGPWNDLKDFPGRYYNKETEAFYTVVLKDGLLNMEHRKYPTQIMRAVAPDQFDLNSWWMDHIVFLRDASGKVTGFEVNSDRVVHLKFEKVDFGK
ncbi:serine hydrolase domain-containing protein [Pollutibacter soli]|uniref:serine hydrolase domain-containing protein n=1 Tax=Pollutibacter soli TaxID=3034157 RepID=UPI0030138EC9